jgi:hypothetical protein
LSTCARTAEPNELGSMLNLCALGIRHGAHRRAPAIVSAEFTHPMRGIAIVAGSMEKLETAATSTAKPAREWTGEETHENGCTYQHELIRCGKALCVCMRLGKLHGPYWYGYARHEGGKTRSWYVGKSLDDPRKPPPWEREEPRRAPSPRRTPVRKTP